MKKFKVFRGAGGRPSVSLALALCAPLSGVAACSSGKSADSSDAGGADGGAAGALSTGGASTGGAKGEGPLGGQGGDVGAAGGSSGSGVIATLTRVCGPEECLSYLNVYESLEALVSEGTVDRSKSLEVPYSQGRTFGGAIYLFSRGEQPTVTRYGVKGDLTLVEEQTISFANTGTTVFCEICNVFGSPERAFHVDATSGTLVSWNPTTMKILEVSGIPEAIVGKLPGGYADLLFPRVFDGKAYYNAGWSNSDVPEVLDRAALLRFDVDDATPNLELLEDERCGGTWAMAPFADEQGNVYAMGDYNGGYYQAGVLNPVTKPACLLRVKPGESTFDPDYYVDLLDTLDAKAIRGAFAMAGGKLLLSILPRAASGVSQAEIREDPWAYYSVDEFRYVVLDLQTLEAKPVSALGAGRAGSATQLRIDDLSLLQVYREEGEADLYQVSGDGQAKKLVSAGSSADFDMIGRVR